MKCIVLDGWHKGSVHEFPIANPEIYLIKPQRVTICDCSGEPIEHDFEKEKAVYKLAAVDIQRECALYSVNGDLFDPLTKARDWTVKDPMAKPRPIYFGCRDERAW